MAFSSDIKSNFSFPVIHLEDTVAETFIEIFAKGALLNSFRVVLPSQLQQNIIDGYVSEADYNANANWFKSAKLSPFVCRLRNGEYEYENIKYKTGKYFIGKEALHGLLYDAVFEIKRIEITEEYALAELYFLYDNKNEGFPFEYSCNILYKLFKNNLLSVETKIKNESNSTMPLNDGWHPYFSLSNTIDDCKLFINSETKLVLGDDLMPTGKFNTDKHFSNSFPLTNISLDTSFLIKEFASPSCILSSKNKNISLEILCDESYPYLQVFTPDHRKSIALEPLSSPPDSLNNKMHLIYLKPKEVKTFAVKYKVLV